MVGGEVFRNKRSVTVNIKGDRTKTFCLTFFFVFVFHLSSRCRQEQKECYRLVCVMVVRFTEDSGKGAVGVGRCTGIDPKS